MAGIKECYVKREERRWLLIVAAIVMAVTMLPYVWGYALQGENYRFTGFVFAAEDGNSYIAKMLSGQSGSWLFKTPYTPLPQKGVLLFSPYILLGKLASEPGAHEQLVALFHIFRFMSGVLLFLATYEFISFFIDDVRLRKVGVILATLGGGLGWLLLLTGNGGLLGTLPLDFYSPETFGFLGLFGLPHIALGRALMFWVLINYLRMSSAKCGDCGIGKKPFIISGLYWLLAGLVQPLSAVITGFVILLHISGGLIRELFNQSYTLRDTQDNLKQRLGFLFTAGIAPGFYLIYLLYSTLSDSFLQAWSAQNLIRSPHPLHYLSAYGLLIPFAVVGGRNLMQQKSEKGLLVVLWAASLPLLAYFPINLQRRLPDGIWVCLIVLSLMVFAPGKSGQYLKKKKWLWMPLLLTIPSTVILYLGSIQSVVNLNPHLFRDTDEVRVFDYLSSNASKGEVVVCSFATGNALPAWAPLRVVIGHGPESANLTEIREEVKQFYTLSTSTENKLAFLDKYQVSYVFWGPQERLLGEWQPSEANFLKLVMEIGEYSLFEVR